MQQEPIPSITSVANEIFEEIKRVTGPAPALTPDQLSRLEFLFAKDFKRALQIVEKGHVKCYIAERSHRKVFQVQGSRPSDQYIVFPQHYCSCQAFLYLVVGHGHPLCKHQLAAQLARALQRCQTIAVPDEVLAHLLLSS